MGNLTFQIPIIFVVLVIIFVTFLYITAKKGTHETTKDLPYYFEIAVSVSYIINALLPNGRFQYRKNVNPEIIYENNTYNSLRHAGVLYSLYLYETYGLVEKYKENRISSAKYFIDRYIKKIDDKRYVVVSQPDEEDLKHPIAKSGAAGIALSALSNLYPSGGIDLEILQGLGEFILSLQTDNGNISAYYNLDKKIINTKVEAIFYPAEAAVGLLYLYEVDKQEKWLQAAKKVMLHIATSRKQINFEDTPFDNWSAQLAEMMFKNKYLTQAEKNIVVSYLEQMAVAVLSKQITNPNNSYFGAFNDNIRPGSIATIMEGLVSIYFCTDSENLKNIIFKSLTIGNRFLNMIQVKTGLNAGGVPNSANWVNPGVSQNAGIIRIDNVQHLVIAWLKFQNLLKITDKY